MSINHMLKQFMNRLKNDGNTRLLSLEILLFSAILGAAFRSWPVFALMFLGLCWLLNRRKGTFYMIFVMSTIWGLLAAAVSSGLDGWGWPAAFGSWAFISGLVVHFRDLKRPLDYDEFPDFNAFEWRQNWYFERPNLN